MRSLLLISLLVLLTGCGGSPTRPDYAETDIQSSFPPTLENAYQQWRGVPYQFGGTSTQGVDCSGLVFRVFDDLYDMRLPRTTAAQIKLGHKVSREALAPADLVFFKTGWNERHVGIYLGQGWFLHASSSRGVIISSLANPYWRRHYLTSRRLAPAEE